MRLNNPIAVRLAGMGSYLPERRVLNQALASELGIDAGWIERTTGVKERRYVTHETAVGMAAAAAGDSLAQAGLASRDLDTIIAASTSRQQLIPCTAVFIQRALGCPEGGSFCFDVDATCLSWLTGLHIVSQLVMAGRSRVALLVSSEIASPSLNPGEPESAVLFGDAAAGAVVRRSAPGESSCIIHSRFETYNGGAGLAQFLGGGTAHHPNDSATSREMNMFHMRGPAIFKFARRIAPEFFERFLGEAGSRRGDYDAVVPHQASIMAIDSLTRHFGFEKGQIVSNLSHRGNTIAASIPLALAEAVASGRITRGQRVLLVGTGAGLTFGAIDLVF